MEAHGILCQLSPYCSGFGGWSWRGPGTVRACVGEVGERLVNGKQEIFTLFHIMLLCFIGSVRFNLRAWFCSVSGE